MHLSFATQTINRLSATALRSSIYSPRAGAFAEDVCTLHRRELPHENTTKMKANVALREHYQVEGEPTKQRVLALCARVTI